MKYWFRWAVLGGLAAGAGLMLMFGQEERQIAVEHPIQISPTPTLVEKPKNKFAVIADIHADWETMDELIVKATERGSEWVVLAGDISIYGKEAELREAKKHLDKSGVEYYVIPGNHDLWEGEKTGVDIFGKIFGKSYQSFLKDGQKFILINNGSDWGLGEKQKQWLIQEIEECKEVTCFAIAHMPLNHNFSPHVMGEDSKKTAAEAKWLLELLKEYKVKGLAGGHLHYATSYTLEGLTTYLVGGASLVRNTQTPRYTEFEMGSKVEAEVVKLSE